MTSLNDSPISAPFLKFVESLPSWTTSQDHLPGTSDTPDSPLKWADSQMTSESLNLPEAVDGTSIPHYSTNRHSILSDFKGKKIYLFLDYDGTLTPIVSDPCQAILSSRMRNLLLGLAESPRVIVGIVTGRALTSVKQFVQISATERLNFLYAASHGFHIEAAGQQLHHRVGAHYIPTLREAALKVSKDLGHIPGITLEDNEFAVSVHYRYDARLS